MTWVVLLVKPTWLWGDIACFQREEMCVSGVPESQKVFTASPGMPGALAEALHKIAELYPNGKKKSKTYTNCRHSTKLQSP